MQFEQVLAGLVILAVFGALFVALLWLKRWSERNDLMGGDFGDRFRLFKRFNDRR